MGRAVDCLLRFNDAAVSRRHLRVIRTDDGVFVENLSLTNGTLLNGRTITANRRLCGGDQIEIGHRVIKVVMDTVSGCQESEVQGLTGFEEEGYSLHHFQEPRPDAPRPDPGRPDPGRPDPHHKEEWQQGEPQLGPAGLLAAMQEPTTRNCPKCRASVQNVLDTCATCAYQWPSGGPAMATREVEVPADLRRIALRRLLRLPIIYSSECLTLEAMARDLSHGGIFIASEILDPVGTCCEITVLPDGRSALHFSGLVSHVSTEIANGRPPGFGVKFLQISAEAEEWLGPVSADPRTTPGF